MREHWAVALIGKPYQPRGRGPDSFDCWGLCCFVWREHYGIADVPDVSASIAQPCALRRRFIGAIASGEARAIERPTEGCAVYMSRSHLPDHIGIYLNGGVLHASEREGVIFTRITSLPFLGFKVLGFYLPGAKCHTFTSSAI